MRNVFIDRLFEQAKQDPDIVLITGDLGFSVLEKFQAAYPEQFINAGIAEQNMTGMAAGMALIGKKPYTYSIANFPTLRCLEQIRNDVCYHNANVKIISVGSGFSYGAQGYTHHGIEDITIMRSLPNMRVYSPADITETLWLANYIFNSPSPGYLRLAKGGTQNLHTDINRYSFPSMLPLITGNHKTILSTGAITCDLYTFLKEKNLKCNLYSVPVIKPLDLNTLAMISKNSKKIITVEEHQLNGGFGSAILEAINKLINQGRLKKHPRLYRLGVEADNEIVSDMTSEVFAQKVVEKISVMENLERDLSFC